MSKKPLLEKFSEVIVDRRNFLFLFYIIAIIFSLFSMNWVDVEDDIVNYLDKDSNTRQGIIIMEEEFTTFGMANIMVSNISSTHGQKIANLIEEVEGVASVMYDDTEDHYKNSSALFVVLFEKEETDEITLIAMENIRHIIKPYDSSVSTTIGFNLADQLTKDMTIIGALAAIVVVIVLIFTSQSYAEIPILLITFGVAALLNMGTNFLLGTISFISNSVGIVLQLALAIDYAIILSHRFTDERENLPAREAAIAALSKAIPEISSSSLTTMAGLAALAFMNFKVGLDLSTVMIKAILLSLLSVFTLMPGLLVIFSNLMNKTKHKSFLPSVSIIGRFSIKTRYIIPPIFAVILVVSFILSSKAPFLFSLDAIRPNRLSENQIAEDRIKENFGEDNMLALIVPSGDYAAEKMLLLDLNNYKEIKIATGLSNIEAIGDYMLTDALTPRNFSELIDLDYEIAQLLYSAYAIDDEDYAKVVGGISQYGVPLIDMFEFLYEQVQEGYVTLDDDLIMDLEEYNELLSVARKQMEGNHYSRMLVYLNLPIESQETFDFISNIYNDANQYYPEDSVFIIGESTNALDLSTTFDKDNLIISILSVLFVIIILTFAFQSAGMPILLISVIQASIWINFSFPYIKQEGLYFLGFLLVSSIQMGANIDYAIIISSRYLDLKKEMNPREAVIEALNQGFPTVITSGTILAIAGFLIGYISTDGATAVLGSYLGQGTVISIILVIFVLPQLLYLGDTIIEKTSFKLKTFDSISRPKEKLSIQGRLHGYVRGEIDAHVDGTISGEIKPISGNKKNKEENHLEEEMEEINNEKN